MFVMVDTNTLAKSGRYLSAVLVVVFVVNLLLDSQVIPFVDADPFLGGVAQFLVLLAASALISIEFMLADLHSRSEESHDIESEPQPESTVDATADT